MGCDLLEPQYGPPRKIVHVDIDPSEINKIKTATLPIIADVRDVLRDATRKLDEKPIPAGTFAEWQRQIDQWRPDAVCLGGNYLANVPEIIDTAKSITTRLSSSAATAQASLPQTCWRTVPAQSTAS